MHVRYNKKYLKGTFLQLSKSLYTRGLQCVKSLWLKKYNKDILTLPNASSQAVFQTGNEVGDLACQLFPDGKKVAFELGFDAMIELTKTLLNDHIVNIYEASFNFEKIFVAIDILHLNNDGSIDIYEVKSSTDVKDVYLHDASIQYYVLKNLGYEIKSVNIIHINNQYVREETLEIEKLFSIVNVTSEVLELQHNIPSYLKDFERVLSNKDNEPNIDIGFHCNHPYDCDAKEYCWKHIPSYSIFNISRLRSDQKFLMYHDGIIEFKDIEDISSFSTAQQIQITSEIEQKEIINKEAIKDFLDTLTYPIYHLDFETFQQAIPKWKGISPFMQIPFQYSTHKEDGEGGLEHFEFLAEDGKDPRYELARKLIEDIPTDVTVLAYNMGFEKGVIRKLAKEFPEFSHHLMCIHDNIKDLMTPFQKKDYYTPSMKGSYSIKNVLPALVPEMELAYKNLSLVHNGGEAMQTFANLSKMDEKSKQEYRKALLEYCKLDTLAMVKVLEKLKESVR